MSRRGRDRLVDSGRAEQPFIVRVAADNPGTRISWATRRGVSGNTFGGGEADQPPQRGAFGLRAKQAVEDGAVELVTDFRTTEIRRDSDGRAVLVGESDIELTPADSVVVLTGFRPDLSFLSEMRLDLDPTLEARARSQSRSTRTSIPAARSRQRVRPTWPSPSRTSTWSV